MSGSNEDREKAGASPSGGFTGERRGDHINIARTDVLAGISGYTEEEQADLLWLHGYCLDVLHGSRSALVEFVGTDWTTVTRIWRGTYEAGIGKFCDRLRHLRRRAEITRQTGFVETVTTRKIWDTLSLAASRNAVVMVSGASGRSKTHAVREWCRHNNHGRSFYIDCPVTGGLRALLEEIARRSGSGTSKNNVDLIGVLERSFDYRHVLVFDEVQRLLPAKSNSIAPLEFLRRLHDTTRCGVVLISTDVFPREMRTGRLAAWFEQLLGRIEVPLQIPEKVSRQEAAEICAAFMDGADPTPELVNAARSVANSPGRVRLLFTLLRHAAMLAGAKKQPLGLAHFQAARDLRDNLNRWPEE